MDNLYSFGKCKYVPADPIQRPVFRSMTNLLSVSYAVIKCTLLGLLIGIKLFVFHYIFLRRSPSKDIRHQVALVEFCHMNSDKNIQLILAYLLYLIGNWWCKWPRSCNCNWIGQIWMQCGCVWCWYGRCPRYRWRTPFVGRKSMPIWGDTFKIFLSNKTVGPVRNDDIYYLFVHRLRRIYSINRLIFS